MRTMNTKDNRSCDRYAVNYAELWLSHSLSSPTLHGHGHPSSSPLTRRWRDWVICSPASGLHKCRQHWTMKEIARIPVPLSGNADHSKRALEAVQ